ncbi:hypothetical protein V6N13_108109 [Hibiscus sabdariffa]
MDHLTVSATGRSHRSGFNGDARRQLGLLTGELPDFGRPKHPLAIVGLHQIKPLQPKRVIPRTGLTTNHLSPLLL